MEINKDQNLDHTLLKIENLSIQFGGLKAVSSLNLGVKKRQVFSIIGPNGAGKTTVFNLISGFYKPTSGRIIFEGIELNKLEPYKIASLGIARTFQNLELFSGMSVMDNLLIAKHLHTYTNIFGDMLVSPKTRMEEKRIRYESLEILKYLNLGELKDGIISDFPFPVQKKIELARALALEPKLLLLDEPAAGLNNKETLELSELIKKINSDFSLTILLIEHDMSMVMKVSDCICVLDYGEKIAEGKPSEIQNDKKVIEAYLGKGAVFDA